MEIDSLALHRIIAAKASTLTFERPKDFDLQKYDDDGRFGFGEGKRLSFRIAKDAGAHLLETPLSTDQQVTDLGDWYEIGATVGGYCATAMVVAGVWERGARCSASRLTPDKITPNWFGLKRFL